MIFGKHINKYYLKYGWMLVIGVLALVVVDYVQLKIPEFYRMMINGINTGQVTIGSSIYPFDLDFLLDRICRPIILIILMIVACRFLWRVCFFGAAIRVETDLRDEMFDHCKELSQQYYQVNKTGDLMSLFTNDLETVQDCFGNGVLMLFDALVLGSLSLYKMISMNLGLSLLCLIPMLFVFLIGSRLSAAMNRRWEKRQAVFSALSDFSQESFSGIAVIKAFAEEIREEIAFEKKNHENEKANIRYTIVSSFLQVLISFAVESIICVILGYGGYLVYKGVFDPGQLVEFIGYFTSIVWPVMAIAMLVEMVAKGKASLGRIGELLDAPVDVCDGPQVFPADTASSGSPAVPFLSADPVSADAPAVPGQTASDRLLNGEIEFRHLNFTYPGASAETLHDLSFHIQAGENIGLFGRTGSGKTTIVDLIARIYNVEEGTIFFGGKDVTKLPIRDVRAAIAYVPQDNFLFSDTIASNIAFSVPGVKSASKVAAKGKAAPAVISETVMKKVRHAAELSDVDENIREFPQQYETQLGERGVTVSGGQKQRISMARALMKNAPVLILDDSVSAVDAKTEKIILKNLKETRAGMTTILIAHRISTISQMDRILFIDEGSLVDFGTHKELLERCPAYADMAARQQLEEKRKED